MLQKIAQPSETIFSVYTLFMCNGYNDAKILARDIVFIAWSMTILKNAPTTTNTKILCIFFSLNNATGMIKRESKTCMVFTDKKKYRNEEPTALKMKFCVFSISLKHWISTCNLVYWAFYGCILKAFEAYHPAFSVDTQNVFFRLKRKRVTPL